MLQKYKFLIVLFFATAFLTACRGQPKASEIPSWITIEGRDQLDEPTWAAAIDAAVEWNKQYDCGREITIRPFETQTSDLGGGYTQTILEQAGPGYIHLGSEGNTFNVVLHAMTHACAGDVYEINAPLSFFDGDITGFEGLSIRVTLANGEESFFTKIEEAVAERNASCMQPGYSVTDPRYFELGKQALLDWPCGNDQIVTYLKNSDIVGLLSDYFGVDREQVSLSMLIELMSIYENAWQRGSP